MPTSKEYRLRAEECLQLAKQAKEFYVKNALIDLAEDFKKQAEKISKNRSEWDIPTRATSKHRMS